MKNFLDKILKNFKESIKSYDSISKSKYWENSISSKNQLFNLKDIKNFRDNFLSKNIDDFYLNKKEFNILFIKLKKKCGIRFLEKFSEKKNIGNAKKIIKYKKKYLTPTDLFLINYIYDIEKKISFNKINNICEIGQGFGLLVSKFLKIKNFKIILIDLPESNFITSYFLKSLYPKKKIILDIDLKNKTLDNKIFKKGDIFILSPWIKINKIKIDFFINSRSMMEMNKESIQKYFDLIQNTINSNGYFLCVNRYYKDLVGYPIEFHKYPFDKKWKIILSNSAWSQPHSHFLFLQRINKDKNNLIDELNKIEKIYKKVVKNDKVFIRRTLPVSFYRSYKHLKSFF